jgi:2-phosphoglycerate kinase
MVSVCAQGLPNPLRPSAHSTGGDTIAACDHNHHMNKKPSETTNDLMQASQPTPTRSWLVLLIGGASGSGKTSISYRLAHHLGIGITEADDIYEAIMHMTTPEQQPILHYWDTHPEAHQLPAEEILKLHLATCRQMVPAFEAVIANHLETEIPLVLEGDYLLPALAAQREFDGFPNEGRVRGLFVHEEDEEQFVQNYWQREPASGRQEKRARVSWLYSQWLQQQVNEVGGIIIPARPWETSFERVLERLRE